MCNCIYACIYGDVLVFEKNPQYGAQCVGVHSRRTFFELPTCEPLENNAQIYALGQKIQSQV